MGLNEGYDYRYVHCTYSKKAGWQQFEEDVKIFPNEGGGVLILPLIHKISRTLLITIPSIKLYIILSCLEAKVKIPVMYSSSCSFGIRI
jgi:hypothetical protein